MRSRRTGVRVHRAGVPDHRGVVPGDRHGSPGRRWPVIELPMPLMLPMPCFIWLPIIPGINERPMPLMLPMSCFIGAPIMPAIIPDGPPPGGGGGTGAGLAAGGAAGVGMVQGAGSAGLVERLDPPNTSRSLSSFCSTDFSRSLSESRSGLACGRRFAPRRRRSSRRPRA